MEGETLTFSQLRKIEKTEKRQEELSELDSDFLLRASRYLDRKKDAGDQREYRNAKRVLEKIIGLRQDKIVKNAKLAVKSGLKASSLEMLPREQEFYREVKKKFSAYSEKIEEVIEQSPEEVEVPETDEEAEDETGLDEDKEDEEDRREGYERVKVVSQIPEFMGTDLESYGPFEEGEKVEVPEENAEILVNRGSAEMIGG
ncbi:MAG: hypothetical protein ABEJ56_05350 [Candidatus Nanohaloarchaea archaeon]